MRRTSSPRRFFLPAFAFVAATLLLIGPAHATWYWVHGQNGHIEYKDRFTNANRFEYGWGLDFTQNPAGPPAFGLFQRSL